MGTRGIPPADQYRTRRWATLSIADDPKGGRCVNAGHHLGHQVSYTSDQDGGPGCAADNTLSRSVDFCAGRDQRSAISAGPSQLAPQPSKLLSNPDGRALGDSNARRPTVQVRASLAAPITTLWCRSTFPTKSTPGDKFEKMWSPIERKHKPVLQTWRREQQLRQLIREPTLLLNLRTGGFKQLREIVYIGRACVADHKIA
jgi:hypothetical protein